MEDLRQVKWLTENDRRPNTGQIDWQNDGGSKTGQVRSMACRQKVVPILAQVKWGESAPVTSSYKYL